MTRVLPALPYFGDNLLLLAEIETALAVQGITEPVLLRASELDKLERVLAHGTDRAGYPGNKRWRWDPALAHEDLILATTPAENRAAEADPDMPSSLRKLPGMPAAMILVYAAAAFEPMRPREYRFRDPSAKPAALRMILPLLVRSLPDGWFAPAEGRAYRAWAEQALTAPGARGVIVEVGCWLGRSISHVATLCRLRGARLIGVDHWAGSSDDYADAYRAMLATRDVEAELRAHLASLGVREVVELRRRSSPAAAAEVAPGSVDLVFLDGSHDRQAVAADIAGWWPRLRAGGILAGHDHGLEHPGVVAAVDAAAAERGLAVVRGPGSLWRLQA